MAVYSDARSPEIGIKPVTGIILRNPPASFGKDLETS